MTRGIGVQPEIDEGIILAADQVMILARLDDKNIAGVNRFTPAVDLDPPIPLQKTERLLIGLQVWALFVVRDLFRRMERQAAPVEPSSTEEAREEVAAGFDLIEI